ncbi:F-box/kelch-repeat protein At3g06240-like [Nicotiana tomentosiformis]|uniref:F-box/kelch-repeat protein At3g06240-like n=1 Tax=Nicotiana tomentosiformis TaxID=4098 RepID=UPI00051BB215|nr:F-box/kelch-repeat protein At3g06240-like [Nicotiana tomentosiformis]
MAKKANLLNQSNGEASNMTKKANLFRCQQQQKKKKSGPPNRRIRKGKRVVKQSKQMDIVDKQATGIHFHEEIIIQILIRLPMRPLHQCKCVSKSWAALISDPYFKMKHLNHAMSNQNSQKLLICQPCPKDGTVCFYRSSLSSVDVEKLDFPVNCRARCCKMLCCSNGLSLVLVFVPDEVEQLFLWNPSTGESIILPNPQFPPEHPSLSIYGLGYDSTSDGFKILKIDVDKPYSTQVLALKSGSWQKIDYPRNIDNLFSGMDSLAFVHGAFHWIGLSVYHSIVSFNISNEVYGEIPLPDQMCHSCNRYVETGVSILGGMLCSYSSCIDVRGEGTFRIWVMKDYGVNESWIKLYTIRDGMFYSSIPKYRFADGEVLLYGTNFRCLGIGNGFSTSKGPFGLWPQYDIYHQGFVFTESLISPKLLT